MALTGKICLVTGASRGLGKGIAVQLGEAGATVYITGRSSSKSTSQVGGTLQETAEEINARGGKGVPVVCDHSKDDDIKQVFDRIKQEQGKLDVLVNNAYAAVQMIMEEMGAKRKFFEAPYTPGEWWDSINNVGLRNHYICSTYAAQMMTKDKSGLIVNVSSFGGQRYLFNVAYGVGKAAVDRMSADMAHELKKYNVTCITLYPGPVLTEEITHAIDNQSLGERSDNAFRHGETPEFSGKAVAALASDPKVMSKTGKICIAAELGNEYGFTDVNGVQPQSVLQLKYILRSYGHTWLAALVPGFVTIPRFVVAAQNSKL